MKDNAILQKLIQYRLIINIIVLSILFFVNVFWQGIVYVIALYLLVTTLLEKDLNGMYYLSFSVAFFCIFKVGVNIYLLIPIGAIYITKILIKNFVIDKKKLDKPLWIGLLVLVAYFILPLHSYSIMLLVKTLLIVVLFIVIEFFMLNKDSIDTKTLFWTFAIGIILSALYALCRPISTYLQENITVLMHDTYPRFSALIEHPNSFAIMCMICISMLAYILFTKDKKIVTAILMGIVTIIPIFTLSKAYLLITVLCYGLMWIIFTKKYPKRGFIILGIGILGMAIFYAVFHSIINIILERFVSSFISKDSGFNLEQITTGRTDLWVQYMSSWTGNVYNIFFGFGLNAPRPFRESIHNMFLAVLYETGIVGFVLFFGLLVYEVVRFIKPKDTKFHLSALLPLVVVILYSMSEDLIFYLFI